MTTLEHISENDLDTMLMILRGRVNDCHQEVEKADTRLAREIWSENEMEARDLIAKITRSTRN